MEQDKFVINIGRQLGSGGKAVGEALGRRLGVHVYDKQLINLAAEQSGLCTELFEQADEKKSRSLFSSLIGYPNELASNGVHHGTFRHEKGDATLSSEQGLSLIHI